jgi:hypothetical protein
VEGALKQPFLNESADLPALRNHAEISHVSPVVFAEG